MMFMAHTQRLAPASPEAYPRCPHIERMSGPTANGIYLDDGHHDP